MKASHQEETTTIDKRWLRWSHVHNLGSRPVFSFAVCGCFAAVLMCSVTYRIAIAAVADEIRIEATRPSISADGRPLPLVSTWVTGIHPLSSGWAPSEQMKLLQEGHYLLPNFQLPGKNLTQFPQSESAFRAYYESAIKYAALHHLPLVFGASQWEADLSGSPYLQRPLSTNPNVVLSNGGVLPKVSPFGHLNAWEEIGFKTTDTEWLRRIREWYPDPSLVVFLSNNEHAKLEWRDAELDARYVTLHGAKTDDEQKRIAVANGWIARYRALQSSMRSALSSEAWKSNSIFVGYEAVGPRHFGRWGGWPDYALATSVFIDPSALMWDGGSASFYTDNWSALTDFTMHSPQIEFMNLVFMNERAYKINPRFWYEMSVWDGHMPDDPATDKRIYYQSLGQSFGPDRYSGAVKFGMWLTRPRVVREFRGWVYPREKGNDYFMSLVAAVDMVHKVPSLRNWWREGELVRNPKGLHPYQISIPMEYRNVDRWFLLDANVNPPFPWSLSTQIRVFALALKRQSNTGAEWLVYAHAPTGPVEAVELTIPGRGLLKVDVSVAGTFVQIGEGTALPQVIDPILGLRPSPSIVLDELPATEQ